MLLTRLRSVKGMNGIREDLYLREAILPSLEPPFGVIDNTIKFITSRSFMMFLILFSEVDQKMTSIRFTPRSPYILRW